MWIVYHNIDNPPFRFMQESFITYNVQVKQASDLHNHILRFQILHAYHV